MQRDDTGSREPRMTWAKPVLGDVHRYLVSRCAILIVLALRLEGLFVSLSSGWIPREDKSEAEALTHSTGDAGSWVRLASAPLATAQYAVTSQKGDGCAGRRSTQHERSHVVKHDCVGGGEVDSHEAWYIICYVMLCFTYCVMLCYGMLCYVYIVPCYVTLYYIIVLWYVMLCYVVLGCVMLCYVMLFYIIV